MASKSPNLPAEESGSEELLKLLEQSLEVIHLESGSIRTIGLAGPGWVMRPHTVVAHSIDDPLWVVVEGRKVVKTPVGGGYILPEGIRFLLDYNELPFVKYHICRYAHFRFRVLGELDLFHLIESPSVVDAKISARVASLIRQLDATLSSSSLPLIARSAERRRLCTEMLLLIISVSRARPGAMQTVANLARLTPVLRYMREQMSRPIYRGELASIVGLSPDRFDVVFRNATQQTPLQYLTRLRMRQAQELLLSTQQSVNEIGQAVGYRDLFHFSKTFKRFIGVSARDYRQQGGTIKSAGA